MEEQIRIQQQDMHNQNREEAHDQQNPVLREQQAEPARRRKTSIEKRYLNSVQQYLRARVFDEQNAYTRNSRFAPTTEPGRRDRNDLQRLRGQSGNAFITVEDMLFLKGVAKEKESQQRALNVLLDGATRPLTVQEWGIATGLTSWMRAGDVKDNREVISAFLGNDAERKKKQFQYMANEILCFDFSLEMLEPRWLSENGGVFIRMTDRASGFLELMERGENQELADTFPAEVKELLRHKGIQARTLRKLVEKDLYRRGVKPEDDFSVERNFTAEIRAQRCLEVSNEYLDALKAGFRDLKNGEAQMAEAFLRQAGTDVLRDRQDRREMASLTYEDFAAMVGTKNRGQITFGEQGLAIINNRALDSLSEQKTREGRLLRERFFSVCLGRLGENPAPEVVMGLRKSLGLDKEKRNDVPMTRKLLRAVLAWVNELSSDVGRILKKGKSADPGDHRFAILSNELVGRELDADDLSNPSKEQKAALKKQILDVLKTAQEKNPSFRPIKLSEHQMDNLVNGNAGLLRDNLFHAFRSIAGTAESLSSGKKADHNLIAGNDALVMKTAALVIEQMANRGTSNQEASDTALREYLKDTAFTVAGKQGRKKGYQDLAIPALLGGAEGINSHISMYGKMDRMTRTREIDQFSTFLDEADEMSVLLAKAVREGLSEAEGTRIMELGGSLDRELAHPNKLRRVADELSGTRYASGFAEALKRYQGGFSFAAETERIAMETVRKEQKQIPLRQEDPEEKTDRSAFVEKLLGKLTDKEKAAARLLLLQNIPSDLVEKEEDAVAKGILKLRRVLRGFPKEGAAVADVWIGEVPVRVSQKEDLSLHAIVGGRTIPLTVSAELLYKRLEEDICGNGKKYGEDHVREIVLQLPEHPSDSGEKVRLRNLYVKLLSDRTGKNSAFFDNLSFEKLAAYSGDLVNGDRSAATIVRFIEIVDNKQLINNEEARDLLAMMEKQDQEEQEEQVVIRREEAQDQDPGEAEGEPEFDEEEKMVQNLLSELLFSSETWEADKVVGDPGKRIQDVLRKHSDAIFEMLEDPTLLDRVLERLPLPEDEEEEAQQEDELQEEGEEGAEDAEPKSIRSTIKKVFGTLLGKFNLVKAIPYRMARKVSFNGLYTVALLAISQETFAGYEATIDQATSKASGSIQELVSEAVDQIFNPPAGEGEEEDVQRLEDLPDPAEAGIPLEEKEKRKRAISRFKAKELDNMMKAIATGQQGQGRFMKLVLKRYFSSVSVIDQRAMLSSAIRNARPQKALPGNANEEQIRAHKNKRMQAYLGGLLKGAGPLLQKMLQGMATSSLPEMLKPAVAAMKSELAPIPEPFVRAQMKGIIDRSGGHIERIEVTKALGAASVGQAFLCKIYGPEYQEGKNVVVKLLRPDVRNRMMREKEIMKKCAQDTDETGGMLATYEGQLERIEEELDLTIEARNAQRGLIYDGKFQGVRSVKLTDDAIPTTNTLVMEAAPGTTVDRYMKEIRQLKNELMHEFLKPNLKEKMKGRELTEVDYRYKFSIQNFSRIPNVHTTRRKLEKILKDLEIRQRHLRNLSETWVTEGVYGEGYYHGDLHAGNIMINNDQATVIDYGNATKLTREQQTEITRMMAAAAAGDMGLFRSSFHHLLAANPAMEARYQERRAELGRIIGEIFQKGDRASTGQRIAVALMKAQELGLQIPAAIYNFSQSQLRMQNTLDEMNDLVMAVKRDIRAVDQVSTGNVMGDLLLIQNELNRADREDRYTDMIRFRLKLGWGRYEFLDLLRSKARRARFDAVEMNFARHTPESLRRQLTELKTSAVNYVAGRSLSMGIQARLSTEQAFHALGSMINSFMPDLTERISDVSQRLDIPLDEIGNEENQAALRAHETKVGNDIDQIIETFMQRVTPFLNRCAGLREKLSLIRQRQDGINGDGGLRDLENEFYEEYDRLYTDVQKGDQIFKRVLDNLRDTQPPHLDQNGNRVTFEKDKVIPTPREQFDMEMQSWFEDTKNMGQELKKVYENYRRIQDTRPLDEEALAEAEDQFFRIYIAAARGRISEVAEQIRRENDEPDAFFEVMGDVIDQNLKSSVKRLGGINSLIYGFKLL